MAGFNFAPINVQQQPQTSLADMMNIARGAQAYQQAQQLNPLALQQAQMTIEQLKQLNPLAVEKARADLSTSNPSSKK